MHRLIYDMRMVFARKEDRLQIHRSEIDHDGFDLILDDGEKMKKLQVKTVTGSKAAWPIHRRLLMPGYSRVEDLGIEISPGNTGLEGGIVLQKIGIHDNDMDLEYAYSDIFILKAFELGILKRTIGRSRQTPIRFFNDLSDRHRGGDSASIPRGAFVLAKGPEELLVLAGLNTGHKAVIWRMHLLNLSRVRQHLIPAKKLPMSESKLIHFIRQLLLSLIREPGLDTDVSEAPPEYKCLKPSNT